MNFDQLLKAYEALEENKSEIPEEFKFLLDPQFKEELKRVQGNAEKIFMAAQAVGSQVGPENVDKETVEEIVEFLKEKKLINLSGTDRAPEEKLDAPVPAKEEEEEKLDAPPQAKEVMAAPLQDDKKDDKKLDKTAKVKQRALRVIESLLDLD